LSFAVSFPLSACKNRFRALSLARPLPSDG
jgi:hypothetical protein